MRMRPWVAAASLLGGLALPAPSRAFASPEEVAPTPAPEAHALERRLSEEFNYDDPAGTEQRLRRLCQEVEATHDVAALTEVLTQVARAQALQGHLDEAATTLDRAEALGSGALLPRVRLLIERGRLLRRQGKGEDARAAFEEAYRLAVAGGEQAPAADAAHMLALLLPFEAAAAWVDRGLVLAEGSADPAVRRWAGVLAYNWGWRLDEHGDHSAAALSFARALACRRIENDAPVVRTTEFALATELRKIGLAAQALAIQERLLAEAKSAKEPFVDILVERVEDLSALGRGEDARAAAGEALRTLGKNELSAGQIERLRQLAEAKSFDRR